MEAAKDLHLSPFAPNASFLYPLETSENLLGFFMFSGVRKRVHYKQKG